VMQSLEDAGIEIPFPQRDLHLRSADGGVGVHAQSELKDEKSAKAVSVLKKTVSAD